MKPLFKLRAHKASVLCCATSSISPDSVFSSSEDGSVCIFDLRTKSCFRMLQTCPKEAVTSICLKPGDEHQLYAAAGNVIQAHDLRLVFNIGAEILLDWRDRLAENCKSMTTAQTRSIRLLLIEKELI